MEITRSLGSNMAVVLRHSPYPHTSLLLDYPLTHKHGYFACRAMTRELQHRAARFLGREEVSTLFPENRTYQDGYGRFRWEFWGTEELNLEALWTALDTDEKGPGGFLRLFNACLDI